MLSFFHIPKELNFLPIMGIILLLFLTLLASHLPTPLLVQANIGGFSVEIFHSNSKMSPFYNPSATPEELAVNAAIDSIARANRFAHVFNGTKFASPLKRSGNSYFMKISIGSPPVEALVHLDTGSDLLWVQCKPCKKCQKQKLPLFTPAESSTYKNLPCNSSSCDTAAEYQCGINKECLYSLTYGSKETTIGVVATDTLTLYSTEGQKLVFPNTVFGCGTNNDMRFHGFETGILGFAMGGRSIVSQLGSAIQNRFMYCLLPTTSTAPSKIKFGADAVLSGPGVVSTALIIKKPLTFYIINLEAITIGNVRILYDLPSAGPGNMVSDSGSTLNHLQDSYYAKVEAAVRKAIPLTPVVPLKGYKLCYDKASLSKLPELKVVYHFTGADVKLRTYNSFLGGGNSACFATVPGSVNIHGSNAQIDFAVSHDIGNNKLSFAPADCTKF